MRNAQNFNLLASDKRWVNLMGAMEGVGRDLKTLAPRPDKKDGNGPLFVRVDRRSNDDGMLATMLISAFMGAHLHGMAGIAAESFGAIDVYDTWQRDRHGPAAASTPAAGHDESGNRGIELGKSGFITGGFNMLTNHKAVSSETEAVAWEAYMQDLPRRRVMEQSLASLNREVDRREKQILRQQRQMAFGL